MLRCNPVGTCFNAEQEQRCAECAREQHDAQELELESLIFLIVRKAGLSE